MISYSGRFAIWLAAMAATACGSDSNQGARSDAGDEMSPMPGEQSSDGGLRAVVDEDSLRWQLVNPNISFQQHSAASSREQKLEVFCEIDEGQIWFSIAAPAFNDKPGSTLNVRRANPSTKTCIVEMREAPRVGEGQFELADSCMGTYAQGGCVLEGAFDSDGWDFAGTLKCTKLVQQPGDPAFSLVDDATTMNPIVIKLDHCQR